jgi:hypothetical protein
MDKKIAAAKQDTVDELKVKIDRTNAPTASDCVHSTSRTLRVCPKTLGWIAEFSEHVAD